MAKAQGKKAAAKARKGASSKTVSHSKQKSKPAAKPAAKASSKKAAKAVVKPARKPAPKAAPAKKAAKKAAPAKGKKPSKVSAPARKSAKTTARKAIPAKPAHKALSLKGGKGSPARTAKVSPKAAAKPAAKPGKAAPKASAKPAVLPKAAAARPAEKVPAKAVSKAGAKRAGKAEGATGPAPARAVASAADDKKKRRPRTRITSNGPATAAWFSQVDKPRPSSFIPAPPRAEAPSLVAAPPASSDRLVDANELTEFAVRTVPVRVDIEAGGGKIYLGINPSEVVLHPGEGIEWDFRYLGGADIVVEELVVEFEKPAPFTSGVFRSRRPGAARPHRQLSGPVHKSALGKRIHYTIRAYNGFKTEMAKVKPSVTVQTALTAAQS